MSAELRCKDFQRACAKRNRVSEESNVRQVVARVALGEADAGIVYQSDTLGDVADRNSAPFPIPTNGIISWHLIPSRHSMTRLRLRLAKLFIGFVRSEEAQRILADNGFCLACYT